MKKSARNNVRRILALAGAVLLVILYAATLIFALTDSPDTMAWFKASVLLTIMLPVLIWAYGLIYRLTRGSKDADEENDRENR